MPDNCLNYGICGLCENILRPSREIINAGMNPIINLDVLQAVRKDEPKGQGEGNLT